MTGTGRRGQSTFEYTALIAVVSAALISMAIYLKRSVSGALRASADSAGEQYDPRRTTSDLTYKVDSKVTTTSKLLADQVVDAKGTVANVMKTTSTIDNDTTTRTGMEQVGAMPGGVWE